MDYVKIFEFIKQEAIQQRSISQSMMRLLNKCQAHHPHPDWNRLRRFDYADLSPLQDWISKAFSYSPPDFELKGLWFGLHNPVRDDEDLADVMMGGTQTFYAKDNEGWAHQPEWLPNDFQAESETLAEIFRIAYPEGLIDSPEKYLGNDAEYPVCLGYAVFAIRDIFRDIDPALILGESSEIGIGVGFNSGDYVLVGHLNESGLRPIND